MFRKHFVVVLTWIICLTLCSVPCAFAQSGAANVAGIVEDSTMARIPDARVRLINDLTGTENDSITGRDGVFLMPGIIPGSYMLQIERQGFSSAQVTGLSLNMGDTRRLLIRLRVGSVSETVEIDATGIGLNTGDGSIGTTVDRKFANNIPANGRSFQDLISITPGVLTQSPQGISGAVGANGGLSVNGQRTDANNFLVDGVSGNFGSANLAGARKIPSDGSLPGLTAIGTTQSLASVDALEEFQVLGSSYSAEYGGAPGGQFTLVTRSGAETGANRLHGEVYDYVRNADADAIDWFNHFNENLAPNGTFPSLPFSTLNYRQNDFGGTLGGPFVLPGGHNSRDKTFLFFSFEALRGYQPTAVRLQYVPSAELRSDVPSALLPVLNDFVSTTFAYSPTPLLLPFVEADRLPGNLTSTGIRMDQKLSSGLSIFLRYSKSPSNSETQNLTSWTNANLTEQTLSLGVSAQISAKRSNDFRLGLASGASQLSTILRDYDTVTTGSGLQPSTNLLVNLGLPESLSVARGQVYIHLPGLGESTVDVDQASSALHQWNLRDIFTLQAGSHFLRTGIDCRHIVSSVNPAPLSVEADFFDANSLLNNLASDISISRTEPATPVFNEFSAFVQDEWAVSKTLTLSPGMRWEVDPPPHGEHGADAYTMLGSLASPATLQLATRGTPLWDTSWLSFAPRFGLGWSIRNKPGQETVLRTGAGVYFNTNNEPAAEAFDAIGFSATNHPENVPVPITPVQLDITTTPSAPYTNTTVFAFPRHLQLPYTLQWNVSIDRALGRNQTLNAAWVGASGRRLLQEQRTNINSENPGFGEINYFPSGISSSYQSLQLKFQRSISPGLQALGSYVWSHAIDYGSTSPEFPLTRGNSDLDVRHNLQLALSWTERKLSGNWFHRDLIGGWGLDGRLTARTGYPVNLMGNLTSDPATGDRYFSGVDRIPGQPLYLYGSQFPGGRAFNGGPNITNPAFVLPSGSGAGNAPRNIVRDFGDDEINAALQREIHLYKNVQLQARAEAFNVLNHPDLGYIDPVVTNQLFGQATLMLNQSFGSSGPLYQPGGPRSIQVSLRLHF